MFEHHAKNNYYLFYTLIIFEILIVVILGFKSHKNVLFHNDELYTLNTDWTYFDENGNDQVIELPAHLTAGHDDSVSISHRIPNEYRFLTHLSILSTHQNLEAYIDDELIYARSSNLQNGFFDVPTNSVWDIIELPQGCEGKIITLIISSSYNDYAGKISEIYVGSKSALIIQNLMSSGWNLMVALITLLIGVIIVVVYLFLKRLLTMNKSLMCLGWFCILCSVWMIMESNLTQIFIANEYVISALTSLTLMTFPIPFIMFISYTDHIHYKKIIYIFAYIFIGTAFTLIFLQLLDIYDFYQTSFIVWFEDFVLLGMVLLTLLLELIKYKNKDLKVFTIASSILFLFSIIELLTYRFRSSNTGVIFQCGFIIFTGILLWDSLRKVVDVVKLSESAKHYKFLATRDLLTNCRNRVSYSRDMDRISRDRNITIYIADMDNMKNINDTYGHHIGDEVIVLCSQCLLNVFGHRVYRIGGDEFVMIQYDLDHKKREKLLKDFKNICEKANDDSPHPFTMSIGYAIYDKEIDKTIYDTVKRADKDMYARKRKAKITKVL